MVIYRLFGLLAVMAIGVVIGVQMAERGIERVSGPAQPVTYIKKVDGDHVELAVVAAQDGRRETGHVNYLSQVGTTLGGWVKGAARAAVHWLGAAFWP